MKKKKNNLYWNQCAHCKKNPFPTRTKQILSEYAGLEKKTVRPLQEKKSFPTGTKQKYPVSMPVLDKSS